MKYGELPFRDCGNCGTRDVSMSLQWQAQNVQARDGRVRSWALLMCPRCAAPNVVELKADPNGYKDQSEIEILHTFPDGPESAYTVDHLPGNVAEYLATSVRVLQAGVPDAAAVQLRRTLEAAASEKGALDQKKPLVKAIEKLIDEGHVTVDFGKALGHVRKVGNQGAHFTDKKLSDDDVRRALLFTIQLLRNLFEVPGVLKEIAEADQPGESSTEEQ